MSTSSFSDVAIVCESDGQGGRLHRLVFGPDIRTALEVGDCTPDEVFTLLKLEVLSNEVAEHSFLDDADTIRKLKRRNQERLSQNYVLPLQVEVRYPLDTTLTVRTISEPKDLFLEFLRYDWGSAQQTVLHHYHLSGDQLQWVLANKTYVGMSLPGMARRDHRRLRRAPQDERISGPDCYSLRT